MYLKTNTTHVTKKILHKMDLKIIIFSTFLFSVVLCAPKCRQGICVDDGSSKATNEQEYVDEISSKEHHGRVVRSPNVVEAVNVKELPLAVPRDLGSCCSSVVVSSRSRASLSERTKQMGMYQFHKKESDGRNIWKNENDAFMFLRPNNPNQWMIGKNYSDERGWVSHTNCSSDCPTSCTNEWKYWKNENSTWEQDFSLSVSCASQASCCSQISISSTGLTNTYHSNILGKYVQDGFSNGRPTYQGDGGKYLHFGPDREWKVSTEKGSTAGYLDSNCDEDCPTLCKSWKTFESKNNCTPSCPWNEDRNLTMQCDQIVKKNEVKSPCDKNVLRYPDASCVLYNDDFCGDKEGVVQLSNGGEIDSIEEKAGFDIASFSVKTGCKLTMYTGINFNGTNTNTLNAKASDGVDKHITLAKNADGNPISEFSDNINSARCTCEDQTPYPTYFKYMILVIE